MEKTSIEEYFNNDELAKSVYLSKYALKLPVTNEVIEITPIAMHERLAKEFYNIEKNYIENSENLTIQDKSNLSKYGQTRKNLNYESIFDLFDKFKYVIPQGSVMALVGNPYSIGSLSNCIVLPKIYDSYGGILYTDQQLTQLMKRRCGCGIDISTLRPEKTAVSNAAGTSTGAISFMSRFSNTTREVAQNGRRGK